MKTIIFDFDGVIHDTFEYHIKKIREFSGVSLSSEEFREIHKKNFFLSAPYKWKNINWKDYMDYVSHDVPFFKIKDNIREIIIELNKKYDLYIVTSGGRKNVSDYLGNNGILDNFKEILGMEIFRAKTDKFKYIFDKYNLSKDECIFITDTLGDIMEANEVGLKTIAVDFGFHNRETLEEGNPFKIISSFNELKKVIN